jgi:DNA-binding Lrp family transcriptional regulator
MANNEKSTKDKILADYYSGEGVKAMITLKVNTQNVEALATEISKYDDIEDVFLVTGDVDIIAKASFKTYENCNQFVLNTIRQLEGIKDTKTLMVVATYKERGTIPQMQ